MMRPAHRKHVLTVEVQPDMMAPAQPADVQRLVIPVMMRVHVRAITVNRLMLSNICPRPCQAFLSARDQEQLLR